MRNINEPRQQIINRLFNKNRGVPAWMHVAPEETKALYDAIMLRRDPEGYKKGVEWCDGRLENMQRLHDALLKTVPFVEKFQNDKPFYEEGREFVSTALYESRLHDQNHKKPNGSFHIIAQLLHKPASGKAKYVIEGSLLDIDISRAAAVTLHEFTALVDNPAKMMIDAMAWYTYPSRMARHGGRTMPYTEPFVAALEGAFKQVVSGMNAAERRALNKEYLKDEYSNGFKAYIATLKDESARNGKGKGSAFIYQVK